MGSSRLDREDKLMYTLIRAKAVKKNIVRKPAVKSTLQTLIMSFL